MPESRESSRTEEDAETSVPKQGVLIRQQTRGERRQAGGNTGSEARAAMSWVESRCPEQ